MITKKELSEAILGQVETFKANFHFPDAQSINDGSGCIFFAEQIKGAIQETFPKHDPSGFDERPPVLEIIESYIFVDIPEDEDEGLARPSEYGSEAPDGWDGGLPEHNWVYFDGLHYDSETPDGVENFFDLPIMQRYCEEIKNSSKA